MKQIPIAYLILIGCLAAFSGCRKRESVEDQAAAPKVERGRITFPDRSPQLESLTVSAVEPPRAKGVRMTGRLVWNDDVTVRVFSPLSGHIGAIVANPGQQISSGDVLARIASPEFEQAQAEARKAVSDLKLAERALSRVNELHDHGAAAQKDLEAAEAEHARAVSEKERAFATLSVYGGECGSKDNFCALKAPIGGLIVEKSINPGQEVRADLVGAENKPLFVISDPARLWVVLDATEAELPSLRPGTEIKLRTQTYPDQVFTARIENISDFVDPSSRTIKVRGTVDNAQRLLKAEMFVSAELSLALQAGVNVPSSAIFLQGDKHFTFIEAAEGAFEIQEVEAGNEEAGITLITKGLQAGQRVVTNGGLLLGQILLESRSQPPSSLALAHD